VEHKENDVTAQEKNLAEVLSNWLSAPINNYGTPFVGHPEDFSAEEQDVFLRLVHEPRFVSKKEQVEKIREILLNRRKEVHD